MGRTARPRPKKSRSKLLQLRNGMGLSQDRTLERLGLAEEVFRSAVFGYELETLESSPPAPLTYAQIA